MSFICRHPLRVLAGWSSPNPLRSMFNPLASADDKYYREKPRKKKGQLKAGPVATKFVVTKDTNPEKLAQGLTAAFKAGKQPRVTVERPLRPAWEGFLRTLESRGEFPPAVLRRILVQWVESSEEGTPAPAAPTTTFAQRMQAMAPPQRENIAVVGSDPLRPVKHGGAIEVFPTKGDSQLPENFFSWPTIPSQR